VLHDEVGPVPHQADRLRAGQRGHGDRRRLVALRRGQDQAPGVDDRARRGIRAHALRQQADVRHGWSRGEARRDQAAADGGLAPRHQLGQAEQVERRA
jgi:hypothetical protein